MDKSRSPPALRAATPAEHARHLDLGASVVSRDGDGFVLADPEGNEFCLSSTEHPLSPEASAPPGT
ncbi:VOC family protein [Lentzea rhizosphaerae]|uniref:VOC family protein n=1 Tax=Lentzea rhizosphaerae TaxID=2041025 RepID=A0ABV8C2M1_9PSEU